MPRRGGMTLMEVLVAIFVMGIGLLSVLAMFPMGSLTMWRAIKDDRAGHAAANAKAIGTAMNVRFDPNVQSNFINPNVGSFADAPLDGPSYPVFADPVGYLSSSVGYQGWVGGTGNTTICRSSLSFTATAVNMLKFCTLPDDITFGPNGQPSLASGGIERTGAVSFAWMLQRPKAGIPSACNMTVVVFNQRSLSTGVRTSAKEVAYPNCVFDPAQPNLLTLTWGAGRPIPLVKEGGYVLDATPSFVGSPAKVGPGFATFYRVATVGDFGSSSVQIELGKPMQGTNTLRTIVIMDGVTEVLDCGLGWKAGSN
jgi:prepilin-type N-terminal cleavage/methylation domain-containing protein